jgi:hypothetical protein
MSDQYPKVVAGASSEERIAAFQQRFEMVGGNVSNIALLSLDKLPPKVTPDYLKSMIAEKSFSMEPNGRTMICRLTMMNGTVFFGFSHTVEGTEFNTELGEKYSFEEAFNAAWDREGYLLKTLRWIAGMNTAA